MITGDHPATALAVADQIGLSSSRVLTGEDLRDLPDRTVADALAEVNVFARVRPEQKLKVVEALQSRGEIVAMTGDGVNDAPALKRADVGVAMGQRGSDVSREVADLVLLDDNFATIVGAIEEGRSIYENVQKFLRFCSRPTSRRCCSWRWVPCSRLRWICGRSGCAAPAAVGGADSLDQFGHRWPARAGARLRHVRSHATPAPSRGFLCSTRRQCGSSCRSAR
jgi:soluble P-type ATPase